MSNRKNYQSSRNLSKHNFSHNFFEKEAWKKKFYTCGIDEVGRGALAGPLVTCAAILPQGCTFHLLRDSKKLTVKQRNEAYAWIEKHALYAWSAVNQTFIDTHTIYRATQYAMKRALISLLAVYPNHAAIMRYVLIDAVSLTLDPHLLSKTCEIHSFPFGEDRSASIAAASIIAKVMRDALMHQFEQSFPFLPLAQSKGYGTAAHRSLLEHKKTSIIHRKTFIKSIVHASEAQKQQSLLP